MIFPGAGVDLGWLSDSTLSRAGNSQARVARLKAIEWKGWEGSECIGSGLLYAEQAGTASSFAEWLWRAPAREQPDQRAGRPVTV